MTIETKLFGTLNDGTPIYEYQLKNSQGTIAKIINYGAILRSFQLADGVELTLGFDSLEDYVARNQHYFGGIIGRVANRIKHGQFTLEGKHYQLVRNTPPHHLHGGIHGFHTVVWEAEIQENKLRLKYVSIDGEENYPGNLKVVVEYQLNDNNEFSIEYKAETDQATPVNLTHHAYWNLAGAGQTILDHEIEIHTEKYIEVDSTLAPTGKILPVKNTPFDLCQRQSLHASTHAAHNGYGHDQCYDLNNREQNFILAALVWEPISKRTMRVFTNQPGMQLYTGNSLDKLQGAKGIIFDRFGGFCLETQNFPDAVNHNNFPNSILRPGEVYEQKTVYHLFSATFS